MEAVLSSLVPSLADRGVFGDGKFSSLTSDSDSDLGQQMASVVAFVRVNLLLASGETKSIPIVTKIQISNAEERRVRDSARMFSNEVNMFEVILPYLNTGNARAYPKYYYGYASLGEEPEKDVVIVENIKHLGYSLANEKLLLDHDHISVVMKKIGQLHAWSFTAKARDRSKFLKIANKVQRLKFGKTDYFDLQKFIHSCIEKGVQPLLARGQAVDILNKFVENMRQVWRVQDHLFDSDEQFGVVFHGDFCKNNIFFSYDSTGKPTDCMYFDFQLSKYGSPAIDLSFFLYMHTDAESREKYWNEFLNIYWTSVRDNVPNDIDIPSFQEFHEHFSCRAVYGYIHCSYFAPGMIEEEPLDREAVDKLSAEEKISKADENVVNGKSTSLLADIVSHLLKMGYIHKFLDYYIPRVGNS